MTNVINKQVGAGLTVKEIALLGGAKVLAERVSSKYVGNANAKSGMVKVGLGLVGTYFIKNRYARFALAGIALDGVEDLIETGSRRAGLESENAEAGLIV